MLTSTTKDNYYHTASLLSKTGFDMKYDFRDRGKDLVITIDGSSVLSKVKRYGNKESYYVDNDIVNKLME